MECILWKIQYVGKAKTAFNRRLNNRRKDSRKPNSILQSVTKIMGKNDIWTIQCFYLFPLLTMLRNNEQNLS